MEQQKNNNYLLPIAIIIAGVLIGGALFFKGGNTQVGQDSDKKEEPVKNLSNVTPVNAKDHILGNPKAPIKFVEYSDTECPFCKNFHLTLQRVISEYGESGQVAWIYRHFPITQLHPKAPREAEATECAAELGGNSAFWKYIDRMFEITPSNNGLEDIELFNIAEFTGLSKTDFTECLESGEMEERVKEDFDNAVAIGARGTPLTLLIIEGDDIVEIEGAYPYESVKEIIEKALAEI